MEKPGQETISPQPPGREGALANLSYKAEIFRV